MSSRPIFAIVGASLAGAKAAETLRSEGFDGRVVLLGDEPERPYERPPLSKAYLRGEASRDKLYVHDPGFYAAHDIELRTSTRVVRYLWNTPNRVPSFCGKQSLVLLSHGPAYPLAHLFGCP